MRNPAWREMPQRARKLTRKQAQEIKIRLRLGDEIKDIAKDFGISARLVRMISAGKVWANVSTVGEP